MCKTNYSVTFVYDGVKFAKEVLTEAYVSQGYSKESSRCISESSG